MDKKVAIFKNELSCYRDYIEMLEELEEALEIMWYDLTGVKGVTFDREPSSFNPSLSEEKRLETLEKIEKLEKEYDRISRNVEHIDTVLSKMNDMLAKATRDIYIFGKRYVDVANSGNFWSASGLHYQIERELERVL